MIPNDPILSTDPLDAIHGALEQALMALCPSLKGVWIGWPDPKWLENTGANLPSVFLVNVSQTAKSMTSRNLVYATVENEDGTFNVYYERERITYLLQLSLITTDPQQQLDIGWAIKQFLVNTIQLPINAVDTARFLLKDDHLISGIDNYYQRDLTFEVSARVLDGYVAHPNKTQQFNIDVSPQGG
ncbi:hypothetical protein [Alicyclobacillus acidoterrestris]|uniref:Uncharacterized protein n=1 Tax=Alicyclobacillus acidoterrestris (strain ATCC 49025 / DSM 3922 / CIP 106132 / NCIMB 13137 / GD3B) TaxID=1356854 RepID=T0C519_ALIAG|nr:hypothetical protein [Alicyclobacillus acidoterrestris]EPZ47635.1 hypothetical protein N007_05095 [Alicyclobacillus acidoterrestris ATCC 49025]UNO48045.1 hypothetical protein K1I37_15335 [Alicyclobacillus acidoterrestris]